MCILEFDHIQQLTFFSNTFKQMHLYLILFPSFFSVVYHLNPLLHFQLFGFIIFSRPLNIPLFLKVSFFAFPYTLNFLSPISVLDGLFVSYITSKFIQIHINVSGHKFYLFHEITLLLKNYLSCISLLVSLPTFGKYTVLVPFWLII